MASVSSVGKAKKFQLKIKTNLSTEARIGLILESYLKLQPRQFRYKIYKFQDTSRHL